MNEHPLPEWDQSPLSGFFKDAAHNERFSALKFPSAYALLIDVDSVFRKVQDATEIMGHVELLVPRILFIRARSAILAGIRLAMSGQVFESAPVLRAAIESSWYALHIASDSKGTGRAEVWLKRNDDEQCKRICKSEFTISKVRETHSSLDAAAEAELHRVYENLIDYGGHPNQFGIMTALGKSEELDRITYNVGILNPRPLTVIFSLSMALSVAIGALKIQQLIYPERFKIMGIDREIERIVEKTNEVFRELLLQLKQLQNETNGEAS